ncbi:MAG: glycosyltransferase family 39 protein [Oscillospiraceae bacterium]|nr:glycosyltransferase family 39 protein [Oscillospiraceae bacterium]
MLRVLFLTRFPPGLNQDEVSAGYEAWALLNFGIDRNDFSFPVLFQSWGSGQNVLYSYLCIPFVAVFGLTAFAIRLPMALCGCASLFIVWHGWKDNKTAICYMITAICFSPWAIMASRWGLESNLFPFCLLLGLYFTKRGKLYAAAVVFALSLYSYGTAFMVVPLFLLGYCLYSRRLPWRAALVFAVVAFPLVFCQIRNVLGLDTLKLLCFTLPKLTETRQVSTLSFDFAGNALKLLRVLTNQSDGLPWNSVPYFGLFWSVPGFLLLCFGVARSVLRRANILTLILLASGLVSALFIDGNINRLNMLMIPIILLQGYGLSELPKFRKAALCAVPVLCAGFIYVYAAISAPDIAKYFTRDYAHQEYIYDLFEEKISPLEFSQTVTYLNPGGAFRYVTGFTANGKEYHYAY